MKRLCFFIIILWLCSGMVAGENTVLVTEASEIVVYEENHVSLDVSNASDGYFMLNYMENSKNVKMLVHTPTGVTYSYQIDKYGEYDAFPFSEGNGDYKVEVYEHVVDQSYEKIFEEEINVELTDPVIPYLYPNHFVPYTPELLKRAASLKCGPLTADRIAAAVAGSVTYDYGKEPPSGYVPDPDRTLESGKGICIDYASMLCAMLRSQGIPAKLETGNCRNVHHAWVRYYSGGEWKISDPVLDANAGRHVTVNEEDYKVEFTY